MKNNNLHSKMKYLLHFYFFLIAIILLNASSVDEKYILDAMKGKPAKEIFKAYHFLFKKEYQLDSEEGVKRYQIFKENLKWCDEKNAEVGYKAYGINLFSDLTNEEFQEKYLMKKDIIPEMSQVVNTRQEEEDYSTFMGVEQGKDIDWRPIMRPVKDQRSCGSCWAHAAAGVVEGNYNIKFGKQITLSEQWMVNCDLADSGCHGGYAESALNFLISEGVKYADEVPYIAQRGMCTIPEAGFENISTIVKSYETCDNCKKSEWLSLLSRGPVAVHMDSSDPAFQNYAPENSTTPVIPSKCGKSDHAVIAVGVQYINGVEHLIIRNSWSEKWGIK
jgi:hypothetical protein